MKCQEGLNLYVVTENPSDFPGKFVARVHSVIRGEVHVATEPFAIEESLERIRSRLPAGLVNLGRSPLDDPVIAEVWV